MYHLIALLIGFFIDLLLGDPHSIPHPVVWIGKLISAAEKLLRRKINPKYEGYLHAGFMILLLILMAVIAFKDIFQLFGG